MYYYFIWLVSLFERALFLWLCSLVFKLYLLQPEALTLKNNWDRIKSHLKSCASQIEISQNLKSFRLVWRICALYTVNGSGTCRTQQYTQWGPQYDTGKIYILIYTFLLQHKLHFESFTCVCVWWDQYLVCTTRSHSFTFVQVRADSLRDGSIHARRYRNSLLLHLPPHSPSVLTVPKFPSMKENKSQTYRRFWLFTQALCWFYFLACFVVVNGNVRLGKEAGAVLSKTIEIIVTLNG